jgi:putative transposase
VKEKRAPQLFDDRFDPIDTAVRERAREFIEELTRSVLAAALARPRRL